MVDFSKKSFLSPLKYRNNFSAGSSVLGMGVQCRVTVSKHPLNHTIFYVQRLCCGCVGAQSIFCGYKFWHRMKQSAMYDKYVVCV